MLVLPMTAGRSLGYKIVPAADTVLVLLQQCSAGIHRPLGARGAGREQPRCLGSALAVALSLLTAGTQAAAGADSYGSDFLPVPQACRPARILLITTGPATKVLPCPHSIAAMQRYTSLCNMSCHSLHAHAAVLGHWTNLGISSWCPQCLAAIGCYR